MSEAAPPNTPTNNNEQPLAAPAPTTKSGGGVSGAVAVLALLIGAGGAGLGGWGLWQLREMQAGELAQNSRFEAALSSQMDALKQSERSITSRLSQFPARSELEEHKRTMAMLESGQEKLVQRLDKLTGASREDWRLAEAEYLLRLANLRLTAMQDINSALRLLEAADGILREQDDPASFPVRQVLARSLEALRSLTPPDRIGLFLSLGALREQAAQLKPLAPIYEQEQAPVVADRWQQWWEKISRFVRVDLHADQDIRPLLSGQNLAQVHLTLALALEQAQWAVLNASPDVYRQALQQAQEVLAGQFNTDHQQSATLSKRLTELSRQPVALQMPDLSPTVSALQNYLQRRQAQRDEAEAAAAATKKKEGARQ
ncbi:uroporphyrinogen-III C-methyltransferase [Azotobacter salinestris]|uniref:uroporphyrinogen-III C-methyltransferase n=1 Tax=Azotobacter salinestris TaxID=69964 RepID=UPI001FCB12C1|nr:uroporphyrinogen-III C-methyltransferase [Azotobacter salinestris]